MTAGYQPIGCGLRVNGSGQLEIADSGDWAMGPLGFPGPDTGGSPIYCGSDGLRTVPEHTSVAVQATTNNPAPTPIAPGGFGNLALLPQFSLANPSPTRSIVVRVSYHGVWGLVAASGTDFLIEGQIFRVLPTFASLSGLLALNNIRQFGGAPWEEDDNVYLRGIDVIPPGSFATYVGTHRVGSGNITGVVALGATLYAFGVTQ